MAGAFVSGVSAVDPLGPAPELSSLLRIVGALASVAWPLAKSVCAGGADGVALVPLSQESRA
eukprot:CAMPEP_0115877140 /NCGR_PEP_ID=MMETSP0287-20121206/26056_1 /TAXON_ID=412157 /ORGANISM="Chrysochromulina rotalis, Strain UIO044" /LENGTH=61 /DNA_ID=CAMNT_0003332619 /DNA_START=433 /DNA_END=614 /DNA_ORIENTATION=+